MRVQANGDLAVAAFLDRRIGFLDIAATVAQTLERMDRTWETCRRGESPDGRAVEIAMHADRSARRVAQDVLAQLQPSL